MSGAVIISSCAVLLFVSWQQYRKSNFSFAVALLVLAGLILRFYLAADFYLHAWDERYHALVAKNMLTDPFRPILFKEALLPYDYTDWTNNHVWLHKQPFSLWMMALSMKIFGVNELALRLPSILFSSACIVLTYRIGWRLLNKHVGYIAAFLCAIHGLIIELTSGRVTTDHVDIAFLFFITLGIYFAVEFAERKKQILNVFCGIAVGIAILCKWLPALIVFGVWFFLQLNKECNITKRILFSGIVLVVFTVLVALPWQVYIHLNFPLEAGWESLYNVKHLSEDVEGHGKGWWYHWDRLRIIYGEIIYLPMLYFIYQTFGNGINFTRLALLTWVVVPFLFFSFAATKMQGYTLFTAPALFIITAWFYQELRQTTFLGYKRILVGLVMFLLIALPIRYSLERIKPFEQHDRNPAWVSELKTLNKYNGEKVVLFNVNRYIEAMFYSDIIAYRNLPMRSELERLQNRGYYLLINTKGLTPLELRETYGQFDFIELRHD
jgi:4-amino-4-deoxy-L-arabinose transferase-like glycosyltransferase